MRGSLASLMKNYQQDEYCGDNDVRKDDLFGEVLANRFSGFFCHQAAFQLCQFGVEAGEKGFVDGVDTDDTGEFVAHAHDADTAGGGFYRS